MERSTLRTSVPCADRVQGDLRCRTHHAVGLPEPRVLAAGRGRSSCAPQARRKKKYRRGRKQCAFYTFPSRQTINQNIPDAIGRKVNRRDAIRWIVNRDETRQTKCKQKPMYQWGSKVQAVGIHKAPAVYISRYNVTHRAHGAHQPSHSYGTKNACMHPPCSNARNRGHAQQSILRCTRARQTLPTMHWGSILMHHI